VREFLVRVPDFFGERGEVGVGGDQKIRDGCGAAVGEGDLPAGDEYARRLEGFARVGVVEKCIRREEVRAAEGRGLVADDDGVGEGGVDVALAVGEALHAAR
jgi:hypothetical protein